MNHISSNNHRRQHNSHHHHGEEDKGKRLRIKSHEAANKPKRKRITPYQFNILSDLFLSTDTPNYQLRENTAVKLNMTNREVQVWFQNRRAKVNRSRLQEQRRQDPFIYPICWTPPQHHHQHQHQQQQHQHKFNPLNTYQNNEHHHQQLNNYDSQSSVSSSSNSSTPTLYPQLLPHMRPIDILALAAEYVQRCDEEKRLTEETRKSWRPWD